jgi:hypothetical protein
VRGRRPRRSPSWRRRAGGPSGRADSDPVARMRARSRSAYNRVLPASPLPHTASAQRPKAHPAVPRRERLRVLPPSPRESRTEQTPARPHQAVLAGLCSRLTADALSRGASCVLGQEDASQTKAATGRHGRNRDRVGPGNGPNFPLYPRSVERVIAVEPEPYLRDKAGMAAVRAPVSISVVPGTADDLPVGDGEADVVLLTLVPVLSARPGECSRRGRPCPQARRRAQYSLVLPREYLDRHVLTTSGMARRRS